MPENNLSSLLERAQAGDKEAYERFLHEASLLIRKRLSRWLTRQEIREEVTQEVLIGIHKNLATFRPGLSAEAWISGISRYKIADYFRKNPHHFVELTQDVTSEANPANDLLEALDELPATLKEVLILTKVDGLSTRDASKKIGIKENALRTRISRAMVKLKEGLLT